MAGLGSMVRDAQGRFLKSLRVIEPALRVAETLKLMIQRRTRQQGLDRFGRRFAAKAGGSPSFLTDSGQMIGGLVVQVLRRSDLVEVAQVVPGTPRDERVLGFHIGGTRHMARRDPWGPTERERASLDRQFAHLVEGAVAAVNVGGETIRIQLFLS